HRHRAALPAPRARARAWRGQTRPTHFPGCRQPARGRSGRADARRRRPGDGHLRRARRRTAHRLDQPRRPALAGRDGAATRAGPARHGGAGRLAGRTIFRRLKRRADCSCASARSSWAPVDEGLCMSALIERHPGQRHGIAIETTDAAHLVATRRRLPAAQRRWLGESGFEAAPGSFALLPDTTGKLARVLVGVDAKDPLAALAGLPLGLPDADYQLASEGVLADPSLAALGWALGAYQFTRYRPAKRAPARLIVAADELARLAPLVDATRQVRDLVNTPTEDMGPEQLGAAIKALGKTHKAKVHDWVGDELLKANFPTIHAVGRASHREPRLIELSWGHADDPRLVIVGKGVCFDTGGLNLKGGDGMRWMKKDMGGAAHAIALAGLIMQAKLPVRLTLLVPAV